LRLAPRLNAYLDGEVGNLGEGGDLGEGETATDMKVQEDPIAIYCPVLPVK